MESKDELWLFCGDSPVAWRMPMRYQPLTSRHGELWYALAPYASHRRAVDRLLEGIAMPFEGMWIIQRRDLEKNARRIEGDPEDHFVWSKPSPIRSQYWAYKSVPYCGFIQELFNQDVIPQVKTWQELAYIYEQICRHMGDTLINRERPVDLIFFRLHNCPLRMNWPMIQFARFPKTSLMYPEAKKEHVRQRMAASGFNDHFVSPGLISYNRKLRICHRHITVEHTRFWWRTVLRVERERLRRLGPEDYAAYFLNSVRRFYDTARRCFRSFMAETRAPAVAGVKGKYTCSFRFVPFVPFMQRRISGHVYLHQVISEPAEGIGAHGQSVYVSPAYGSLSEMRHLQLLKEKLRDRVRAEVERFRNGTD